ncbi:2,3-diketo-L-gulonate-binding periplasmic protein YiaO precursor [Roseovarius gaetbuli]|uniref:2,3-diketo-L-gulonate-binding periplasmic protein YiaO n=2 Tax=Roseovarius TaxID=74030 RepID=A0A1X6Z4T9_9RHOB|nr:MULTISPECIES: C4-dicarboxylate ABC transporter substrate-binding protein [Roseovarius]SHK86875.1 TRAP-type C4-dicarboxylate transport system, substrate-binding protein [Roseovarius marisflavi]SLN40271.1 2,3-diketo-L-gulonate-binding periplasmic protein YiaO precursor [Roseovarius gaetbuli]
MTLTSKALAPMIAAAAIATTALPATAETVIRLSTYVNEADIRYDGFVHFAELVSEKTGGSVKVEIFPSSTLHGWSEGVDAVQGGVSDMSWIPADERLPCYRVTSLYPVAIDLENQVELDAGYAALVKDEAAKVNLMPVFNSNYSYDQEWWFEDGIEDLGKLDGKLVRSIGPLVSLMIETWGGQPVFVAPKEVFQSAERGVVDGINMGVATYSSWKLWSVMPYMVNANLFYGNVNYMMNMDKFNGMTADEQAAVLAAASETETWLKPRYEDWVDQRVGNAVMKGGGAAVSIPQEQRMALIDSVQGTWDKEVDAACGAELAGNIRALFASHAP